MSADPIRSFLETRWALPSVLAIVALLLLGVFKNQYVYDDEQLIVHGPLIHDWKNLPGLFAKPSMAAFNIYSGKANPLDTFRPLTIASFMWDAALSGKKPWSYHLTNLLGHLLCVALVYRLARLLLPDAIRPFAPLAALFFGLHPIAAEAHIWISGRYDVLSTAFGLSSILCWHHSKEARSRVLGAAFGVLTAGLFLLGLLSKETLVMVIPALVLWPVEGTHVAPPMTRFLRRIGACWPFALALLLYLGLRLQALGGAKVHHDAEHALIALSRVPALWLDAIWQALFPTRTYLRMLHDEFALRPPWQLALSALVVLVLALLVLRKAKQAPLLAWSLLWFFLPLAPVGLISTMHWPGFGRYLYLPNVGLAIGSCWACAELFRAFPRLERLLSVALGAYFLVQALLLHGVVASYRDPQTLYATAIEARPDVAFGYAFLAGHYSTRLIKLRDVARLYELARERDPSRFEYAKALADTYLILGKSETAVQVAQETERRLGQNAALHLIQAQGLFQTSPKKAVAHVMACLALEPGHRNCLAALQSLQTRSPPEP